MTKLVGQRVEVKTAQQVIDSLGAHLSDKLVGIGVIEHLIALRQLVEHVEILLFSKKIKLFNTLGCARVDDHVTLIIYYGIKLLGGKTQKITYLIGQRTEIPDVSHRHNKADVSHTLAAHLLFCDHYTATVANNALIADTLILSAVTFIVLYRTEYLLTEKTIALGLIGAVVDGFRLGYLSA